MFSQSPRGAMNVQCTDSQAETGCHASLYLVDIPSWGLESTTLSIMASFPFSALAGVTRSWFPQPSYLFALWCCEAFEGGEVLSEMHNLWHQNSFGRCLLKSLKFAVESCLFLPFHTLDCGFTVSTGMWWHAIFTCKTVVCNNQQKHRHTTTRTRSPYLTSFCHVWSIFHMDSIIIYCSCFHCCSYIASWFNQSGSGNSIWALQ